MASANLERLVQLVLFLQFACNGAIFRALVYTHVTPRKGVENRGTPAQLHNESFCEEESGNKSKASDRLLYNRVMEDSF